MKRLSRTAANTIATITGTLGIAKVLGSIEFSSWATDSLIHFAGWFGAYGDEQIEDVYMVVTILLSFVTASALVWSANKLLTRARP
ncbi:non-ribosomal peptide synthetase [Trinickia sp.]|uniref:non-ribosomal peptide synthetase n=1 Tax=Trinickia sp. TaxID=2571163 RepID=UPI003F7FA5CD